MEALEKKLREHRKSGVYRAVEAPAHLQESTHAAAFAYRRVDATPIKTKSQFLGLLGRSLSFPSWYGRNWDALEDCLTDLSWIEEAGLVVEIEGYSAYAKADPDGFAILLDIFKTSAEYWRSEGKPFWVIFTGPHSAKLELPVLLI